MNPFDLIKNMKQIQQGLQEFQNELPQLRSEGRAGGNMVICTVDGTFNLVDIKLDPMAMDPADPQLTADLVLAAFRQAHGAMKQEIQAKMAAIAPAGTIPPGMFGL